MVCVLGVVNPHVSKYVQYVRPAAWTGLNLRNFLQPSLRATGYNIESLSNTSFTETQQVDQVLKGTPCQNTTHEDHGNDKGMPLLWGKTVVQSNLIVHRFFSHTLLQSYCWIFHFWHCHKKSHHCFTLDDTAELHLHPAHESWLNNQFLVI